MPKIKVITFLIWIYTGKTLVIGALSTLFKAKAIKEPIIPPASWQIIYRKPIEIGYLYVFLSILKTETAGLYTPPENCRPYDIHISIVREKSKNEYIILAKAVWASPFKLIKFNVQ